MYTLNKMARLAGTGYLIIFITGIYANFFVLESMLVPGDAVTTVQNVLSNSMLFRSAIASFVIMVAFDVLLAWLLYVLLKPVNSELSLFSGWLRLVNGTIFAIALYNLYNILHMLGGADYLTVFEDGQLQAQVMLSFNTFNNTWLIGLVFFAMHLGVLGYLIYKSGYIPKIIGVLLIIAAFGYLIDSFAHFLLTNYTAYKDIFLLIVIIPGVVGELSFTFWLLIKGDRIKYDSSEERI